MATTGPDFAAFVDWERNHVQYFPIRAVKHQSLTEWNRKTRRQEYIAALNNLQNSLEDAKLHEKKVPAVPKKATRGGPPLLELHRKRQQAIANALGAWRVVMANLQVFSAEQGEADAGGVIANTQSRDHTNDLVQEARAIITQRERDIQECRAARTALGGPISPAGDQAGDGERDDLDRQDDEAIDSDQGSDDEDEDENDSSRDAGDEEQTDGSDGDREASDAEGSDEDDGSEAGQREESDDEATEEGEGGEDDLTESEEEATRRAGALETEVAGDKDRPTRPPHSGLQRTETEDVGNSNKSSSKRSATDDDGDAEGGRKRQRGRQSKRIPSDWESEKQSESAKTRATKFEPYSTDGKDPAETPPEAAWDDDGLPTMRPTVLLEHWTKCEQWLEKRRDRSAEWPSDFFDLRGRARNILRDTGEAILPEFTIESNVNEVMQELTRRVEEAEKQMQENKKRRAPARDGEDSTKVKMMKMLGFGGPGRNKPIDGNFVYTRALGSGTYGHAALWIRYDASGNIVDRVAVKDCHVNEDAWDSQTTFYGDMFDWNPREAYMHASASAQDRLAKHIIRYRAKAIFLIKKMYRIYIEYCPHGDLFDLKYRTYDPRFRLLATPALWAIFESLAKAEHLLAHGAFPDDDVPLDWDIMVHRDIKADNVFFAEPDADRWKGIPMAKIGDFGMAALQSEEHLQRNGAGTEGNMSPEVVVVRETGRPPKNVEISTPADIWSIGIVMLELMNSRPLYEEDFYTFELDESMLPEIQKASKMYYPPRLVELVELCLRRLPEHRIGVEELCEGIDQEIEELSKANLSEDDKWRMPFRE